MSSQPIMSGISKFPKAAISTGIATQKIELRKRIDVELSARRLERFFKSSVELMEVMARACGHDHLNQFNRSDLITWNREMTHLAGVPYGGVQL